MSRVVDKVFSLAQPIVESRGLNLVDVEYQKEGEKWYLRVYIENPEEDLQLKDCEVITRMVGTELDQQDFIDRSYILEVSSPGLERPLKTPSDFRGHVGKDIYVKTYAPVEGQKEFEGMLKKFKSDNQQTVKLELDEGVIEIPFTKIAKAHLTIDF